jgi:hypothetical protein
MKKYMASLIPFLFCSILSYIYGTKAPKDFPDPSYPYQTKGTLSYLSTTWFYVGIIMSAIFISMLIIGDIFDYVAKASDKKKMDKYSK